jgi:hypothetical protein
MTGIGFVGLLVVSAACSTSESRPGLPADQAVTALRGTIKGTDGKPISGVAVKAGAVTATSNAEGKYDLKIPTGDAIARFSKDGFVDGIRAVSVVDGRPTQVDVTLLAQAPPVVLDSTAGGTVNGGRGARVIAPAGAFVDGAGKAVTGPVNVYLTPLDPSVAAERASAPGFLAQQGGTPGMLESFGMVDITVKQGDQRLNVAAGKELELRIPAPAGAATPAATMPLWSFDESKGVWVDEGTATYDPATKTYVGKAKHMSLWNCDQVLTATCICGLVKEKSGAVLPGARIEGSGIDYFGTSTANANNDGKFCLAVRKDSEISLAAYHRSGGGTVRNVRSGSADTNVPPQMGDARCVDVGVWEVERDVFVTAGGTAVSCGNVPNPFANSCATELGSVFGGCYKPEGSCTTSFGATGATVRFANGAYYTSDGAGGKYYSSTGQLCATATFEGGADGGAMTMRYTLPNNRVFTMTIADGGKGDMVIGCPDGGQVRVTPEQRQALEACSQNQSDGGGAASCTNQGFDGGGVPGTCTSDTQCNGQVCCTIPNSTTRVCLTRESCDSLSQ